MEGVQVQGYDRYEQAKLFLEVSIQQKIWKEQKKDPELCANLKVVGVHV